jgi:D-alanyl-D-alanine dipeptidase
MIQIKDSHEPLVNIKKVCPSLIVKLHTGEKKAYLRKSATKKLCQAKSYLPTGYTLIINDAWRSAKTQQKIYKRFLRHFTKKYPGWSNKKIKNEVKKFVAPFSGKRVSGHMTGGAIDLRLYKNGKRVPMWSSKLTYQENAQSIQPKLPAYMQKNRAIMFDALLQAGFANYRREFWHWSYGDLFWARKNNKKYALYGMIEKK